MGSVVSVPDLQGDGRNLFISRTLLFGQKAAVYEFNRAARAIREILARWGGLAAVDFFDDYPQVEPAAIAPEAKDFMSQASALLGWEIALED